MIATRDAAAVLDLEFLQARSALLELAAALDRLERAEEQGGAGGDPRAAGLRAALHLLTRPREQGPRANAVQEAFSRQYLQDWRQRFQLPGDHPHSSIQSPGSCVGGDDRRSRGGRSDHLGDCSD